MANKIHCDVCDATPATDMSRIRVPAPGSTLFGKSHLNLSVVIQEGGYDKGEPIGRKDVCDECRTKLVAEAFNLKTAAELYELRDQITELTRQLALVRAGEDPPAPPMPVDPDIPF